MPTQTDFHERIAQAAGLVVDANCSLRCAGDLPLPAPHRRKLGIAIAALDKAQTTLFQLSHDPWHQSPSAKPHQLELL